MLREEEYVPIKKRRALEEQERLKRLGHLRSVGDEKDPEDEKEGEEQARPKESLLVTTVRAKRDVPEATEAEKRLQEEQEVLKQITTKQALKSVKELAKVGLCSREGYLSNQLCVLHEGREIHTEFGNRMDTSIKVSPYDS